MNQELAAAVDFIISNEQAKLQRKPFRLQSFSAMLAGYCSEENYEKWVEQPEESPAPSPEMKL